MTCAIDPKVPRCPTCSHVTAPREVDGEVAGPRGLAVEAGRRIRVVSEPPMDDRRTGEGDA